MTLVRVLVAVVAFLGVATHAVAEERSRERGEHKSAHESAENRSADVHTVSDNLYCDPSKSPCSYEKSLKAHTRYYAYTYCGTAASHTSPKSIHCSSPSTIVDCDAFDVYECDCNENNAAVSYQAKTKITCE